MQSPPTSLGEFSALSHYATALQVDQTKTDFLSRRSKYLGNCPQTKNKSSSD